MPRALAVALNTKVLTATFSESMDPATLQLPATFTLACPAGTAVAGGTVGYILATNTATLTLPAANLPASTTCEAKVTTAAKDVAGNAMIADFVWSFGTSPAADTTPPTVTATINANGITGVSTNTLIGATFSEAMNANTLTASTFSVKRGTTTVAGALDYSGFSAVFTPTAPLAASTLYTMTVSTGAKDVAGNALASNFVWSWTTSAAPDTTAPTVSNVIPAIGAINVPVNADVGVTFSEAMNATSVSASNFLLKESVSSNPVAGSLALAAANLVFTTTADLLPATSYTVTIKGGSGGLSDMAGNVLAADYVWSWTTAAVAPPVIPPTVTSTNPPNLAALGVCLNKTVNATFDEAMNPLSINNATFTLAPSVSGVPGVAVIGTVSYDALNFIATFVPTNPLTSNTTYIATVKSGTTGVQDLLGNPMAADKTIQFTTSSSPCATAPVLGAMAPFGGFGGIATLTNDGLNTQVNGSIGVAASSTKITGLRDSGGNVYTITPNNNGLVNGTIYTLTAPPGSVAGDAVTKAGVDALAAFNSISPANLPGGVDVSSLAQCPGCGGAGQGPGQLAGRTLPPGIYLSATGTYGIGITAPTADNLTLDAGGDANAVWVFQTAAGTGTLTVGLTGPITPAVPIKVLLLNGAQAKNVFWYVPGGATIGTGSTMVGTMLANASITLSTTGGSPPTAVLTTLNGRAIALTAGVTMTNTVINVPAP
jgi:hypothetical protein